MTSKYMYVKKSITERRLWLDEQKAKPCSRCGIQYPPYVMDWHHRDPKTKKFGIGTGSWRQSRKALEEEMKKCDLVCSNCHRVIEFDERKRFRNS